MFETIPAIPAFPPQPGRYVGQQWLKTHLPQTTMNWLLPGTQAWYLDNKCDLSLLKHTLHNGANFSAWQWPDKPIIFLTDLHADAEALSASLVASGFFARTGPDYDDLALLYSPRLFEIILGGDIIDKGPSNLQILQFIQKIINDGVQVTLLSGNHDLRLDLAIHALQTTDVAGSKVFITRLGDKVLPLLQELLKKHPLTLEEIRALPPEHACKKRLLADDKDLENFKNQLAALMPDSSIKQEIERYKERAKRFTQGIKKLGLTYQQVYSAFIRYQQMFHDPQGEFYWFFSQQKLLTKRGSLLFLHAGLSDQNTEQLLHYSEEQLNQIYQHSRQTNPFEAYYGVLSNMLRTKHRRHEAKLTLHGQRCLDRAGIKAVLHGHRSSLIGQRICFRANILHFECDAMINRSSRASIKVSDFAAAATVITPSGNIYGISNDFPAIKVFKPALLFELCEHL